MIKFDLKSELSVLQEFQKRNCDLSGTTINVEVYNTDVCTFISLSISEWDGDTICKRATRNVDGFLSARIAIEDIVLDLTGSYEV